MREYGLFIDGKFVGSSSGETVDSIDPSTGEIVARVPKASKRDARKAIDAARRAFDDGEWSERSPESRRDALLALCDRLWDRQAEIADLESRDSGMTIRNATVMVAAGIQQARDLIKIAAEIPLTEALPYNEFPLPAQHVLVREPYGVVSAIVPFNAPFVLAAWKIFPALAMGNTIVLKPSPHTPCSAMETAVAVSRERHTTGRLQRPSRRRRRRRRGAGVERVDRPSCVHRFDRSGQANRPAGRADREARDAGARREEREHLAGRRRPGRRDPGRALGDLPEPGTDVSGREPADRSRGTPRRDRRPHRFCRDAAPGRPVCVVGLRPRPPDLQAAARSR
ncbi:MAG: aldehyde dehydrogenase family protein, partial [Actinobacteria bacterium]